VFGPLPVFVYWDFHALSGFCFERKSSALLFDDRKLPYQFAHVYHERSNEFINRVWSGIEIVVLPEYLGTRWRASGDLEPNFSRRACDTFSPM
jgi:hypothetical protein